MVWVVVWAVLWALWPVLRVVRVLWDLWVDVVLWVMVGSWRRKSVLPPVFNPILLLSASSLAHNIRERKISSVEVVRSYITRISNVNPILNALAQEHFEVALFQAQQVDERLDKGYQAGTLTKEWVKDHQPLLGVPFTVKETIAVAGLPHTGGLLAREDVMAIRDARIVTNMKKAGAILLCSTNISELGMWWESNNPVYGRTSNPYDTRRTPGGSSGGEAAMICACGSPLGLGTDLGGSVRTPAFFCGLFAHKPTASLVSVRGCNIHDQREFSNIQTPGPLTRHACDLAPVLAILAGDRATKLNLGKSVDPGCLKIYTMESDGDGVFTSKVAKVLLDIQRKVTAHFQHTYDCNIHKVKIPGLQRSYQIWKEKLEEEGEEGAPMVEQLADKKGEINVWTEITRALLGRARHTFPSLAQALLDKLIVQFLFLRHQRKLFMGRIDMPEPDISEQDSEEEEGERFEGSQHAPLMPKELKRLREIEWKDMPMDNKPKPLFVPPPKPQSEGETRWKTLQLKIQRLLGESGILIYPSHPSLAPYHSESFLRPFNFTYASIFNALGFPVTQVPLGLAPNGLPLGIQVVGGMYQDNLCIVIAQDLEKAFGGWICPSKIL